MKELKVFVDYLPKQPQKCGGCIWGSWNGIKQYCSKLGCVKE
jgi:hypothetical protein